MKNKNNYKYILLFLVSFIFFLLFSIKLLPLDPDEIWNYGFGYSMSKGLLPYKDINFIVPPLWPLLTSIFIKIFGKRLISLHILNSIVWTISLILGFKLINKKIVYIFPIFLIVCHPTYNSLVLLLIILFLYLNNKYKNPIINGIIISLITLAKHTVGGVFFILEFIITNNKKKYTLSYLIPILICICYLLHNNILYDCINYCLLGIFDFASKNSNYADFFSLNIMLILLLLYKYKKTKNKEYLYAVAAQSIVYPLFDSNHFFLGLIIILIVNLKNIDNITKRNQILYMLITVAMVVFGTIITFMSTGNYIVNNKESFMYKRNIPEDLNIITVNTKHYLKNNKDYDKLYIISKACWTYLIKIDNNIDLDKYDIILNGNMGKEGYKGYIKDIDNNCTNKKCLFLVYEGKLPERDQTNREIINHIVETYEYKEYNFPYSIYKNY